MAALLWIMTILFVILTVLDPRKLWYATTAWQFKNPEANEPSEASFALGRVVSGIAAAGFGCAAIIVTAGSIGPLTQDRLDTAGSAAASELTGSYYKYGTPNESDIKKALGRDDVDVKEVRTVDEDAGFGEAYDIEEYYDVTSPDDDTIQGCMKLSYEGGLFADDDVVVSASWSTIAC
jgi:hypothetical protein